MGEIKVGHQTWVYGMVCLKCNYNTHLCATNLSVHIGSYNAENRFSKIKQTNAKENDLQVWSYSSSLELNESLDDFQKKKKNEKCISPTHL